MNIYLNILFQDSIRSRQDSTSQVGSAAQKNCIDSVKEKQQPVINVIFQRSDIHGQKQFQNNTKSLSNKTKQNITNQ